MAPFLCNWCPYKKRRFRHAETPVMYTYGKNHGKTICQARRKVPEDSNPVDTSTLDSQPSEL